MSSNFENLNTPTGKPADAVNQMAQLQRRQVLKGALGGVTALG